MGRQKIQGWENASCCRETAHRSGGQVVGSQTCPLLVQSREENHPYLLKIRYELNPNDFDLIDNIAEMKRIGGNHVRLRSI